MITTSYLRLLSGLPNWEESRNEKALDNKLGNQKALEVQGPKTRFIAI